MTKKHGNFKEIKKDNDMSGNIIPSFSSPKNWTEDYKDGENQYICKCLDCGEYFFGYKRRSICKECFD